MIPSCDCHTFSSLDQGSPSTPIWLDNLECTGSEARLVDCNGATTVDCSHGEDVGLFCLRSFSSVTPFGK